MNKCVNICTIDFKNVGLFRLARSASASLRPMRLNFEGVGPGDRRVERLNCRRIQSVSRFVYFFAAVEYTGTIREWENSLRPCDKLLGCAARASAWACLHLSRVARERTDSWDRLCGGVRDSSLAVSRNPNDYAMADKPERRGTSRW